jgi:hypothetical protein
MYGLQTWGETYVAARIPVRGATVEASYWHLFASEDDTNVTIEAHGDVTGINNNQFVMNQGDLQLFTVAGSAQNPGDFLVEADKPIYLMQYMSSSYTVSGVNTAERGDPAMMQAVPVEQFRDNYVILVPSNWIYDWLVVTKKAGETVSVDGNDIPQEDFVAVGPQDDPTGWEVARITTTDGVHVLDGSDAFSVTVLGYDSYDSYAYPGGLDQQVINPQ